MSSFLCFVCHSTVNADTNEDTREKYREVIGMHLCPDSHLCFICCHFLNKMCLFKSICLKRSLEYPVLFSEKGTINLQRSDIAVAILCPEDICLQHLNTRYHFYNNSENSQSDFDDNNYCELQDDRIFDVHENLPKTDGAEEFHNEEYLFSTKDNIDLFSEDLNLPNLEPVRITQNDLVNGEWTKDTRVDRKKNDTVLYELQNKNEMYDMEHLKIQDDKIENHLNLNLDSVHESLGNIVIDVQNNLNDNLEHKNYNPEQKHDQFADNESKLTNEVAENTSNSIKSNDDDYESIDNDVNDNLNEENIDESIENTQNINIKLSDVKDMINSDTELDLEHTNIQDKPKKRKRSKKDFEMMKLSVKEQKTELEQARREEKYITAAFKCYNCAISFHFKDSYQAHMMRHEESNGEYRCSICSLRFANPAVLRSHSANHSERYRCTRCDAVVRARQRQTHLRSCKSEQDSITCHLCGSVFQGVSHLQQHIKRFHESKSSNRNYLCNVCGKSYNNRAAVRTHMITHINRKFPCDECSALFSSPYTLNQHKKTHSYVETELHYCTTCKLGYNSRKSLLAHLRNSMAHKESVYKCPVCGRSCPSLSSLHSHTAAVHARTKHLACALCARAYCTRKALLRHLRTHKNETPKQTPLCHACGEKFKSTGILKRHLKNVCEKDKLEEELTSYYEQ